MHNCQLCNRLIWGEECPKVTCKEIFSLRKKVSELENANEALVRLATENSATIETLSKANAELEANIELNKLRISDVDKTRRIHELESFILSKRIKHVS